MTLSIVLMICDVRETGLKFAGDDLAPPLWIGTTKASLRMEGIVPFSRKYLKSISSGSARLILHLFKTTAGTPSGPAEELGFSWSMASFISSLSI